MKITGKQGLLEVLQAQGFDRPLVSHIHKGKAGKAGPVYIPLGGAFAASRHTRKYPAGAVRGQHKAHD